MERVLHGLFLSVIPAKAEIQQYEILRRRRAALDSRLRGNDKFLGDAKVV
jgi:hypothetical protein